MKYLRSAVLLLMAFLTVEAAEERRTPRLPEFTRVEVRTTRGNAGAMITAEYEAPEEPYVFWLLNSLPIPPGRVDYMYVNDFSDVNKEGKTILSSLRSKQGKLGVCLLNTVGEVCMMLNTLSSNGTVREVVKFPWPLMTPGPRARYRKERKVQIHAPVLDTPHQYIYTATLYSKNPQDTHGRMVEASTTGMAGGSARDVVTIGPVSRGDGWMLQVRTDQADYEGVMLVNTIYTPQSGLVEMAFVLRPFTIYRMDHNAPFAPGFVAAVSRPAFWRCLHNIDCMVICPFVSNGHVNVTISRMSVNSVLGAEFQPGGLIEEQQASTKMLGQYYGYGYVYIPAYNAERDAGTYKCTYRTADTMAVGTVEVF